MLFWRPPTTKMSASQVTVNGAGLSSGTVGEICSFSIHAPQASKFSATSFCVAFEGPSKPEIKFSTSKTFIECSWLPRLPGFYKIFVRYLGEEIPGSPFYCKIESGSYQPASQIQRIKVHGKGLTCPRINRTNEVIIEEVAGVIGGLSASMEGPSKPQLSFSKNPDDTLSLLYKASVRGEYVLNVKFTDHHVPGSPFTLDVS